MIRTGQTIENPVTGERVTFRQTSADTGGEAVVIDVVVEPNGYVAAAHLHPKQDERFEVHAGTLEMRLGQETRPARGGDVVVVPAGTPHRFETSATSRRASPARSGRRSASSPCSRRCSRSRPTGTNRKGMPSPLRLAVIARAHFDTVRLPSPPAWVQRVGLALGAPFGRLLGYGATYEGSPSPRRSEFETAGDAFA